VRAEDPPTTRRRVTAAATSSMKLPSPKAARWLQSQERNLGAMVTVSFQLTTIPNEEVAEAANRHYLNEGSGKEKRESACAMTTGAIHPSTERDGHRWIQARGGPLETATMNEVKESDDVHTKKTCCNSIRADAYATLADITS
jgi:hypothetical protein